ncbi:MAG: hypothetical protein MMC33_008264 [Icmadophila ericetorum]|nr:hypothetical protein [Icmadophila ericetorum]
MGIDSKKATKSQLEDSRTHDAKDEWEQTALHRAVSTYHPDLKEIEKILEHTKSLEVADKEGKTTLRLAVECGSESVIQLLLDQGADTNAQDRYGDTALHETLSFGHEAMVRLLLYHSANARVRDEGGQSSIHLLACGHQSNFKEALALLLANMVDINAKDQKGKTALHIAAANVDYRTQNHIEGLLQEGADINAKDQKGNTALHIAVTNSQGLDMLMILSVEGADIEIENNEGELALRNTAAKSLERLLHNYLTDLKRTGTLAQDLAGYKEEARANKSHARVLNRVKPATDYHGIATRNLETKARLINRGAKLRTLVNSL